MIKKKKSIFKSLPWTIQVICMEFSSNPLKRDTVTKLILKIGKCVIKSLASAQREVCPLSLVTKK